MLREQKLGREAVALGVLLIFLVAMLLLLASAARGADGAGSEGLPEVSAEPVRLADGQERAFGRARNLLRREEEGG